jgi:hypothetical protein
MDFGYCPDWIVTDAFSFEFVYLKTGLGKGQEEDVW